MSIKWTNREKKYPALYPVPYFINFGKHYFKKPWDYHKHQHQNYEIIYIVKGSEVVSINEESFLCKANELFVVEPGDFHEEKSKTHPLEFFCLSFSYKDLAGEDVLLYKKKTVAEKKHILNCDENIKNIYMTIHEEAVNKKYGWIENVESLIIRLVNEILRDVNAKYLAIDKSGNELDSLVERVKIYISDNLTRDLSLESIAKAHYVSPSSLSHSFKKITGLSPVAYIIKVRIELAKKLLSSKGSKVKDVAARTGFNDPYYFSKMFKKLTGKNPVDYT